MAATRILLIEDDEALGSQIIAHLARDGYESTWWKEGKHLEVAEARTFGLVILDLMLPGTYGMDILAKLRSRASEIPVLILSARNDTHDKVRALKLGADDFMTKPFWPEELLARVRARLRRPTMQANDELRFGSLVIDIKNRDVRLGDGPILLTRVEFDILLTLAQRPGAAITRQAIVEAALDPERDGTERTLDVHVSRLRKKLGHEKLIETVWGIGYRLRPEVLA